MNDTTNARKPSDHVYDELLTKHGVSVSILEFSEDLAKLRAAFLAEAPRYTDTFISEDGLGTPALWLRGLEDDSLQHLLSKDDLSVAVNRGKPAYHGSPSREVYVDRLWDAIAATAGPAPEGGDQ